MNQLVEVIKNNSSWPLVLVGVNSKIFKTAIKISAKIKDEDFILFPTVNGIKTPAWVNEIKNLSSSGERCFLVLENLDEVEEKEQEKFFSLVKNRAINGYKLPSNAQILIPCQKPENISKTIIDCSIIYETKK